MLPRRASSTNRSNVASSCVSRERLEARATALVTARPPRDDRFREHVHNRMMRTTKPAAGLVRERAGAGSDEVSPRVSPLRALAKT